MTAFQESMERIHCKRRSFQDLSRDEFVLLLADTILDRHLFASPHWNWRYGGVRYIPRPLPLSLDPARILILQWPGNLGDACMAAPFLSVLRQRYPRAEISFLSSQAAREVFSGSQDIDVVVPNPLDPYLDRMISGQGILPEELLEDIHRLAISLAEEHYDLAVNLQVLPMSATLARLSAATETIGMTLSGDGMPIIYGNIWAPYLFGVSAGVMRKSNPLHRTEIFRLMLDEEQCFTPRPAVSIPEDAVRRVQEFLDQEGIGDHEPLVGLNPMSGTPIRQWPHFDRLAAMLRDNLGARVMIFGSRAEDRQVGEIVGRAGKGIIQATHFTLQELMAAISGCDLFIANETGPMHLACLLGRKVIALFGPTSFGEVGPWGTAFHVIQSSGCRNCYRQKCVRPAEFCMDRISAEEVHALAESELKGTPHLHLNQQTLHHASGKGVRHDNPELLLGRILLEVFRERWRGTLHKTQGPGAVGLQMGEISEQVHHLKSMVDGALRSLSPGGHPEGRGALIDPLILMNDLQFLDKRVSPDHDLPATFRFYQGLQRDLSVLKTLMGETRLNDVLLD